MQEVPFLVSARNLNENRELSLRLGEMAHRLNERAVPNFLVQFRQFATDDEASFRSEEIGEFTEQSLNSEWRFVKHCARQAVFSARVLQSLKFRLPAFLVRQETVEAERFDDKIGDRDNCRERTRTRNRNDGNGFMIDN